MTDEQLALISCGHARRLLVDSANRRSCAARVGPGPFEGRILLAEIAFAQGDPGAELQARQALQGAAATDYAPSPSRLRLQRRLAASEVG